MMKGVELEEELRHPRYEYVCESQQEGGLPLLHTYRILVKEGSYGVIRGLCAALLVWLIWRLCASVRMEPGLCWVLAIGLLFYVLWRRGQVEQEAVVVMPTLGVQLETLYRSKNVKRRFVPLHRILRPVINEAVTPTTCYTYLALLLRDDSRLTLTFLHVRPPLSMLVPIWSALCAAVDQPLRSQSLLREK